MGEDWGYFFVSLYRAKTYYMYMKFCLKNSNVFNILILNMNMEAYTMEVNTGMVQYIYIGVSRESQAQAGLMAGCADAEPHNLACSA